MFTITAAVYHRDEQGKGEEIYCLHITIFCTPVSHKYNHYFTNRNEAAITNSVVQGKKSKQKESKHGPRQKLEVRSGAMEE